MLFVDDAAQVAAVQGVGSKHRSDGGFHLFKQSIVDFSFNQDIIGGNTGLSRIQAFAPDDSPSCQADVGICLDDDRAFPPQFQGNRGDMLCRTLHHQSTHLGTAGEENVIVAMLQEFTVHLRSPLEGGHMVAVKELGEQFLDHQGGVAAVSGRLENDAVACRNGADQRCDGELERVVPRAHDQHDAQRLGDGIGFGGKGEEAGFDPMSAGPGIQMLQMLVDLRIDDTQLGGESFKVGFPQILIECIEYLLLIGTNPVFQTLELFFPPWNAECGSTLEKRLHLTQAKLDFIHASPPFSQYDTLWVALSKCCDGLCVQFSQHR